MVFTSARISEAAYAPAVTLNGAGQSIGLFELDGFYASDVQANFTQAGLTAVPTQTVLLDGFNGAPGSGNIEVIAGHHDGGLHGAWSVQHHRL